MKGVKDTHLRKSKAWKEVEKREKEEKIGKVIGSLAPSKEIPHCVEFAIFNCDRIEFWNINPIKSEQRRLNRLMHVSIYIPFRQLI